MYGCNVDCIWWLLGIYGLYGQNCWNIGRLSNMDKNKCEFCGYNLDTGSKVTKNGKLFCDLTCLLDYDYREIKKQEDKEIR